MISRWLPVWLVLPPALVAFLATPLSGEPAKTEVPAQAAPEVTHSRAEAAVLFGEIYRKCVDKTAKDFFAADPELQAQHGEPLRAFILEQKPEAKFVEEALRGGPWLPPPGFLKALRGVNLGAENFGNKEFDLLSRYAAYAAMRSVLRWRDVYVAKFVEKDEAKHALFDMDTENLFTEFIPMVYGAVSYPTFEREVNESNQYLEYDEVGNPVTYAKGTKPDPSKFTGSCQYLGFCSPPATTNLFCNVQGFLIVRHNQIIALVITFHS